MEAELSFDVTFSVVASGYNLTEISNADSSKNLINKSKLLSGVSELKPTGFFNLKKSQRRRGEGSAFVVCTAYDLFYDACKDKAFLAVTFPFGEAFRSSPKARILFLVCLIFIILTPQRARIFSCDTAGYLAGEDGACLHLPSCSWGCRECPSTPNSRAGSFFLW